MIPAQLSHPNDMSHIVAEPRSRIRVQHVDNSPILKGEHICTPNLDEFSGLGEVVGSWFLVNGLEEHAHSVNGM